MASISNINSEMLRKQYNIDENCEIYQLQPDGSVQLAEGDTPLQSKEIFLIDKTNSGNFPCSHALLTDHWQPEDYLFVFAKGLDQYTYEEDTPVLLQRGMLRFGCCKGLSMDSIIRACNAWKRVFKPIDCMADCLPDGPSAKVLVHRTVYPPAMLIDLAHGQLDAQKIYPAELAPSQAISDNQIAQLQEALESVDEIVKLAAHQSTSPFQCKNCKHLKGLTPEYFEGINAARMGAVAAVICTGCMKSMFTQGEACSVITCAPTGIIPGCLSSTKICTYCVNGATGLPHNLGRCTELMQKCLLYKSPLPPMRMCSCE